MESLYLFAKNTLLLSRNGRRPTTRSVSLYRSRPHPCTSLMVQHTTFLLYLPLLPSTPHTVPGLLITGSPGVGKSTFARLIFYLEMRAGQKVLWVDKRAMFLYDGDCCRPTEASHFNADTSDIVVIFDHKDGFSHVFTESKTFKKVLAVHSPSGDINSSQKAKNLLLSIHVMNPWSIEEARLALPNDKQLDEKFNVCGGLMRHLESDDVMAIKRHVMDGVKKLLDDNAGELDKCSDPHMIGMVWACSPIAWSSCGGAKAQPAPTTWHSPLR